jgi:hypothetical protein
MGRYVRRCSGGRYDRTTGQECDGCGKKKGEVPLRNVHRRSAGAKIVLTFCAECEEIDDALDRGLEPWELRPPPTPQEIVNARPAPPRVPLAPGWTTALPRLRRTA